MFCHNLPGVVDFWEEHHRVEALLMASYQGVHDINMTCYYWDVNIDGDQFCFIMFYLKTTYLGPLIL